MKKIFLALVLSVSFLVVNCIGTPKIKFDELETKTFTLLWVTYMTNMNEFNQDIPDLFDSLPITDVVRQVESQYGIIIDTALFKDAENNRANIKQLNLGSTMAGYEVDYETQDTQFVGILFGKFRQQKELDADISLYVGERHGKTVGETKITIKVPEWNPYKK